MTATKTKTGTRRCAFCKREFKGDKRRNYCSVACREQIVRSNPACTAWAGFHTPPANESPRLDRIHAVTPANDGGGRSAACGLYGRFIAGISGDFESFDPEAKSACWRCREARIAWADPTRGVES